MRWCYKMEGKTSFKLYTSVYNAYKLTKFLNSIFLAASAVNFCKEAMFFYRKRECLKVSMRHKVTKY